MVQQRSAGDDFVLSNLQSVAICSALSKNVEFSDLEQRLFGNFEENIEDVILNHNVRSSYLAAGICILYARDDRFNEPICNRLMELLEKFLELHWADDSPSTRFDKVTIYEQFTFCLNTILADVAAYRFSLRDTIIEHQLNLLEELVDSVEAKIGDEGIEQEMEKKADLMRVLSMIFGLVRSFGRFASSPTQPLISHVFPPPFSIPSTDAKNETENGIPRLLKPPPLSTDSANWFWNDSSGEKADPRVGRKVYSRHGSSFMVAHTMEDPKHVGKLTLDEMERLVKQLKRLLDYHLLQTLNSYASDVYATGDTHLRRFAYRSVSEAITLCAVTVLRDTLQLHTASIDQFSDEFRGFVAGINTLALEMFNEGQQQLKERSFNEDLRQSRSVDDEQPLANRLKMLIIANSMCIELIVWSCGDENTADLIYSTINERISQPHRHVLIQTPITVVALDALGKLAERFPSLAYIIVTLLCNFLTEPYPLLTKLEPESTAGDKKHSTANGDGLIHLDGQDSVIRRRFGFTSLRSAAIDALCRALKSAIGEEENDTVLQACLAKLSAHLYLASQDKKSNMTSQNTILALGNIGIALKDKPKGPDLIFPIFLQIFGKNNNPAVDSLIINTLADMWINGTHSIFTKIMQHFSMIIIGTSNRIYSQDQTDVADPKHYPHASKDVDAALVRMANANLTPKVGYDF